MQNPRRDCKLSQSSSVKVASIMQFLASHALAPDLQSSHKNAQCDCTLLRNMHRDPCGVVLHVYAWSGVLLHKPRSVVGSLLWPMMSQSSYKNYHKSYTLVFLKRRHHCLFCPSRAGQEAKKAAVVSKCRQNFWTKRCQRNPHDTYVKFSTESLMTPDFQHIIEVCSS